MEEPTTFLSESYRITGLLDNPGGEKAVVVTHPHPLYGGDMQNPVVAAIVRAYRQCGYTTLRFNFRGVGASEGRYANGSGEKKDVLAALGHLMDLGAATCELAGYSFGAWVNAHAVVAGASIRHMLMVSPPVAFMDFSGIDKLTPLSHVITGSADDIAPALSVKTWMDSWNPEAFFQLIAGADHFYTGHLDALTRAVSGVLRKG